MFGFLRVAWSRVCSALRLGRVDQEFQKELASHLELMAEENMRRGMSPEGARHAARVRLGGVTQLREANREMQGLPILETLGQDLRYAWRMLRKRPALSVIAVLTLALGIGANTAIFSVINAVFLRPLPFPNANRLYLVGRIGNRFGGSSISMPIFIAWQGESRFFDHIALYSWLTPRTLTGSGEAEQFVSAGASTDLFAVLGVHPRLGREFLPEEGKPGGANVVMISDQLWRNRFHSDPDILGRRLALDSQPYVVVGVLPPRFNGPFAGSTGVDLWFPIRVPVSSNNPSNGGIVCVGLLKSAATPQQAEQALTPPLADLRQRFLTMFVEGERARLQPLREFIASGAGTAPLLLFGAVMLVLLIACVNVANLLLASATGRRQELAMRAAMGARRKRIARQLLTESVLLSVIGGAAGVGVCYALFGVIVRMVPSYTPRVGDFRIDGVVLAFSFLLSIVTGVLFGLAPALGASRLELNDVLKSVGVRTISGGHSRLRRVLAANELALSLVLLVGASLALQSLSRLLNVQPGFDPSSVLTFRIDLPALKYPREVRAAVLDQFLTRFAALPGVQQASAANTLPFVGGPDMLFNIEDGRAESQERLVAYVRVVSPDFFRVLRVPLDHGREFNAADRRGSPPVLMINRTAAKQFWPKGEPIGASVWIGKPMGPENAEPSPRQIVGVVGDVHESSLADPPGPTLYIPLAQSDGSGAVFALRTTRMPMASVADVRNALRSIDADLPMTRVRTMEDIVALSLQDWRFRAVLLGSFGALALFIAAIGVYGVISYSVAQRTHEIGVRVALGADRNSVLRLVLRQGMSTALLGIGIGLVAAFALTRVMANLLFGVDARDPLTFSGVAALLAMIALGACYVPARRAMKVDPMVALRCE